jgi:hypothetical protein
MLLLTMPVMIVLIMITIVVILFVPMLAIMDCPSDLAYSPRPVLITWNDIRKVGLPPPATSGALALLKFEGETDLFDS